MKPISPEVIQKVRKELASKDPLQDVWETWQTLEKEQPAILAYLRVAGGENLNENERQLMVATGMVVWKIMLQGDKPLTKVTPYAVAKQHESNMKMLDYLEGESEDEFTLTVAKILINYSQKEVLKFVVKALTEDVSDDRSIRDEYKGLIITCLKTVIDCFDK